MKVQIEYSNRHIHISKELAEKLYGEDYQLNFQKKLSQAEDFASQEVVTIMGPKGKLENVRILGPYREKTQIEISKTDAYILGIDVPIRLSGDIKDTPGVKIITELNEVNIEEGVIIAKRHLHVGEEDAKKYNLKNGQILKLKVEGERGITFDNMIVRVGKGFQLRAHIDIEEANAGDIAQDQEGEILI